MPILESAAKRNALAYYMNTMVTAIVGLIVNPLLLGAVGTSHFGTWKAMQRVLDVGSAANGGAMQSLKWVIAHRSNNAKEEAKRRDVGAALAVLLYWSPILIAVTGLTVGVLPLLLEGLPQDDLPVVLITGGILGFNVLLVTLASVPDAVLVGTNQAYRSTNVTTAVFIGTNAGMVAAAMWGLGLQGMAAAIAIGTAINGIVTLRVLKKRVPWWGYARPTRDDIRRLSSFSGWVLAWTVLIRLSLATEWILLAAFAGVAVVSAYTFTSYIVLFGLSLCQLTTSSFMPKLGSLIGTGEWERARSIARESRELTLALAAGVSSLVIILNESFVSLWAGGDQFMGAEVNMLMAIAFFQFAVIRTDAQIQDAGLKIANKVILGAGMTVAALIAGGAALILTGSIAMMFIAVIATRLAGSIAFPIAANRVVQGTSWPLIRTAAALSILAVSIFVSRFVEASNVAEFVLLSLLTLVVLSPVVAIATLSPPTLRKIFGR